ncbi:MAG: hypothetical protein JWQ13_3846 [Ramlibacter sp.]|jgi:hypothetical protein|nr:hypothetical protein [Ramlibacter sp.]
MLNSSHPTPAFAADTSTIVRATAGWDDLDDVALGCECADPALQIACWGQEASDGAPAANIGS